jgi:hypothetical protein
MNEGMSVTWKEYVDTLDTARKDAVAAALLTVSTALAKADTDRENQLKALGDKIDSLTSRAGGSVPRGELEALLTGLGTKFEASLATEIGRLTSMFTDLNDSVSRINQTMMTQQGARAGLSATGKMVASIIAAVVGLVAIGSFIYAILPHP